MSVPPMGSRAAVDYWAVRARREIQRARSFTDTHVDHEKAMDWATNAAGAADEFRAAVLAYNQREAKVNG